jgi:hypothetical protein
MWIIRIFGYPWTVPILCPIETAELSLTIPPHRSLSSKQNLRIFGLSEDVSLRKSLTAAHSSELILNDGKEGRDDRGCGRSCQGGMRFAKGQSGCG